MADTPPHWREYVDQKPENENPTENYNREDADDIAEVVNHLIGHLIGLVC